MCESNTSKKNSLGRRRIEIKKIEKKSSLQVTFTKRRTGLFKKASELALLCGSQIAILVQSPAGKIYSFGHPSVEALIQPAEAAVGSSSVEIMARSGYEEAVVRLEREKRRLERGSWWSEPYEGLELHELEEYLEGLQILTDSVSEYLIVEVICKTNKQEHKNTK